MSSHKAAIVPDVVSQVASLTIIDAPKEEHNHHLHHHIHRLIRKYSSEKDSDEDNISDDDHDACCPRSPVTFGPSPAVEKGHGLSRLLRNNKAWSKAIRERQPDFFEKCSQGQQPKVFWIGCSDSRVPENELLQLGKMFDDIFA